MASQRSQAEVLIRKAADLEGEPDDPEVAVLRSRRDQEDAFAIVAVVVAYLPSLVAAIGRQQAERQRS